MRHLLWTFAALLLIALLPRTGSLHAAERSPALQALGTEFRLILSDGSVLGSRDMVGAVLTLSSGLNIRIDAVEGDPTSAPGDVLLHSFSVRREDGSWTSLCSPGPDGRQQGFPLAGRALPDGRIVPAGDGDLEVVCTSGAQGKCVRFGYKPWLTASDGRPLRDHYNACVHMVRADYCGDGTATTRDGTLIDLYDRAGIQRSEAGPGMRFEAGWGPEGAVCLARVRIQENTSLERLRTECPRLAQRPLGAECSEATAEALGALVFNNSVDPSR